MDISLNNATASAGTINGLNININNSTDSNAQGVVGIQSNARVQVNATTQLVSGLGFQIGSRIEHAYQVPIGSPVTGTDSLGLNFAGDLIAQDDIAVGGFGLGWVSYGQIASMGIAATKTVDKATVALITSTFPDPGFATGGAITDLDMIRTAAPIPQGGTAVITNLRGLHLDSAFGDFGTAATNSWFLYLDSSAENYIKSSLNINTTSTKVSGAGIGLEIESKDAYINKGALSLGGATSGKFSQSAAAVTTPYSVLWPAAQGAASTVLTNDGAGNLSWSTTGTPGPTLFTLANNQTSFADVTGFLVNPASNHAFTSEISVERTTTIGTITLLDQEDTSFYSNLAYSFSSNEQWAGVLSDGSIALGGNTATPAKNFVKVLSTGATDTTFATNLGTGINGVISSKGIAIQADDSILFAGTSTLYNGTSIPGLGRVSSAGILDTTFNTNLGTGANGNIEVVAVQADQKIIVAGPFTSFNGTTVNRLARLNTDGTLDTTFNTNLGTGFDNYVLDVRVQADQKIVVGGGFTNFNGNARNRVVRLNSDGTEDTTFSTNIGTGANNDVHAIIEQSDTKLVLGGEWTTFNGNGVAMIVRLNNDGTEDTAFSTNVSGVFTTHILALSIQSSGKIIAAGSFTSPTSYLARLNTDGTVDTAFSTSLGSGFNSFITGCVLQPNDQIIVQGGFTTFNGVGRNSILRYEVPVIPPAYDLISQSTIKGVYHSSTSSWTISSASTVGDDTQITLQMTDLGQLQYKSSDLATNGRTVTLNQMKFEIEAL